MERAETRALGQGSGRGDDARAIAASGAIVVACHAQPVSRHVYCMVCTCVCDNYECHRASRAVMSPKYVCFNMPADTELSDATTFSNLVSTGELD